MVLLRMKHLNYNYNFHKLFSLKTNTDYFDGLFRSFSIANNADTTATFEFFLDNGLEFSLKGKPTFNIMLGYDPGTDSVEFAYPWIRPVRAKLTFDPNSFQFSFNKNYLRFSIIADQWEVIDVFRSILMVYLIRSGSYMVHGAAIKLGDDGILVPSFANTGKTTAAWMLAKRGAKYLTDELAILDSSGNCFSLPCSSLLTSGLIESLGLNLTKKQRLSMRGNNLKSRLLSTRFAPGGIRLNPKDYFLLSDMVRITKAMFLQNGPDEFRKLSLDEATKRLMAIRSFELGWDSNPYLVAESFFNPRFDLEELRTKERAFASAFLSELREVFLISSSNHSHYKMLEDYKENVKPTSQ